MKRIFTCISLAVLCLICAGQQLRTGKLDNGLTYYIYHNEHTPGCADFFIAHNVGALQEEDNQNGLAHFLEHMAFNGTRHYPGKGILNFLSREGVRFGYNVNAYTNRSETVYNISKVPLVRESFVDSVLLVLHDWSCDISCEQQALDEERGVISEEWRLRDEPRYRMSCRQNDLVYQGAKHPNRTVIGSYEVINNFKREEILDFYHKWYRPDLQVIIIVGDVDLDTMEARVRAKFSDIPLAADRAAKPASYLPAPLTEPLYGNQTDHQIKYQALKVLFKQAYPAYETRNSGAYYKDQYCRYIINSVLNDRLQRLAKAKNSPMASVVSVTSDYSADYYVTLVTVSPRRKDNAACLELVQREINRLVRHGISNEEFVIAKMNIRNRYHLDREVDPSAVTNDELVRVYIENFLRNKPCWTPVEQNENGRTILAEITRDDALAYIQKMFCESGVIYSNCCNIAVEKDMPSYDEMRAIVAKVNAEDIPASYISYPGMDLTISSPAGAIVSDKPVKNTNIRCWRLSNGATIYFRKSAPVKTATHTSILCEFPAGYRAFDPDKVKAAKHANNFMRRNLGAGGLARMDFKNDPQVTALNIIVNIGRQANRIEISLGKNDLENAFKYLNVQLSNPYFPDESVLEKFNSETLKSLGKLKSGREKFHRKAEEIEYGNNPWLAPVDSAAVRQTSMDLVKDTFQRAYGDVASMKVYICSDADEAIVKDFVQKYIASLAPGTKSKLAPAHYAYPKYKGVEEYGRVCAPVSAPVTNISYKFNKQIKPTPEVRVTAQVLDYILSERYLNKIREERGGTYHISFYTEISALPKYPATAEVSFQTRPEMRDMLLQDVEDIMNDFVSAGPTKDELDRAIKYLRKRNIENKARIADNVGFQNSQAQNLVKYGIVYDYDYEAVLDKIDAEVVRKFAARLASGNRFVAVYSEQ